LATELGKALLQDERVPQDMKDKALEHKAVTLDVLADAIEDFGLSYEFKILRLIEKLYWNGIRQGVFGPIYIPNSVDAEGKRIPTPVGQIKLLMDDIFDPEFLAQFDEEGEPLP
jgi:hypothetical protein